MTGYFTPAVFKFLRELEANNDKEWWEDNKDRYIVTIREPALDFVEGLGEKLKTISPHFVADARTNGGSLMRPYRDMRFSRDKTPYKTNVGIQFRHERGKDVHAPGFYVHLEPGESFLGAGMWRPGAKQARTIRQAINDDPTGWSTAAHSDTFATSWTIGGDDEDRLKRIPRELDPDHPFPDDLRLRSFTAGSRLTQKMVTSSAFGDEVLERFAKAAPYTRFLCEAIGVPF
jgi:uncharacterized protein (TIGR02453 family)